MGLRFDLWTWINPGWHQWFTDLVVWFQNTKISKIPRISRILYKVNILFIYTSTREQLRYSFLQKGNYWFLLQTILSTSAHFHLLFFSLLHTHTLTAGIFLFFCFGDILREISVPFMETAPTSSFVLSKMTLWFASKRPFFFLLENI